jgi:hypothetical protein
VGTTEGKFVGTTEGFLEGNKVGYMEGKSEGLQDGISNKKKARKVVNFPQIKKKLKENNFVLN